MGCDEVLVIRLILQISDKLPLQNGVQMDLWLFDADDLLEADLLDDALTILNRLEATHITIVVGSTTLPDTINP